jgi:hypothetical protein
VNLCREGPRCVLAAFINFYLDTSVQCTHKPLVSESSSPPCSRSMTYFHRSSSPRRSDSGIFVFTHLCL